MKQSILNGMLIDQSYLNLLTDCLCELSHYSIRTIFTHNSLRIDNTIVNGYWKEYNGHDLVLACRVKPHAHQWIPCFAHEFCHFKQWEKKNKYWRQYDPLTTVEYSDIIHNHPIAKERLNLHLDAIRDLEADCERKTVALLKRYNIVMDYETYIKDANIYIFLHNYIKQYRAWIPYNSKAVPEIHAVISSKFYKNYKTTPPEINRLFEKHFPITAKSKAY